MRALTRVGSVAFFVGARFASGEKKLENHIARDTIGLASLTAVCARWSALERLLALVTLSSVMWW